MAYGYVYKITNTKNGKFYIGQTTRSVEERWTAHRYCAKSNRSVSPYFYSAIRVYGPEMFRVETLAEAENQEQLNSLEIKYIEDLNATKLGYNLSLGGGNSKHTKEMKLRKRLARLEQGKIPRDWRRLDLESLAEEFDNHTAVCAGCRDSLGQDGLSADEIDSLLDNLTQEQEEAICAEGWRLLYFILNKRDSEEEKEIPWSGRENDPIWVEFRTNALESAT